MNTLKTRQRFIIIVLFVALMCSSNPIFAKIYHLTILHTNDHNGHFLKFSPWANPDIGGLAAQSTLINTVRAEVEQTGGHVLLLSAGNVNIGPPESNLLYAEPDFKLMHMLGYDAMTLGNDEITMRLYAADMLERQREWAGFPFLSANTFNKVTGELLDVADPYLIKEFDGLRVAIFGLTMEETAVIADPKSTQNLEFRNVIETAQSLIPKLRTEADIVIGLTHLGFFEEKTGWGRRSPDDVQLAREVPGIDVIVGGQSLTVLEKPEVIGQSLIVQAGCYGMYVGRLDLTIDSDTDTITAYTYKLLPVNLKKQVEYQGKFYYTYVGTGYVEDPAVLEFIQPYLAKVEELLSQPVGEALVRLVSDDGNVVVRRQETNLANLVTDAMRDKTGAEITLWNAGNIRTDIEPGPITYRDILGVHQFGTTVGLMDMTGAQLMEVLSFAATMKSGAGGFLQVSGMTWTINKGIPEDVMVGGHPLELDRMYKVVTSSYFATGGDGYTMFTDIPFYDTGFTDAAVLREYIMKLGTVAPKVEGRLTIIE